MHKFSLALGDIIAITAMMVIPTTNFHVAKAYSCSGSSSAGKTPSSSTSVSGNQGSILELVGHGRVTDVLTLNFQK
jgi:hypothetical protein